MSSPWVLKEALSIRICQWFCSRPTTRQQRDRFNGRLTGRACNTSSRCCPHAQYHLFCSLAIYFTYDMNQLSPFKLLIWLRKPLCIYTSLSFTLSWTMTPSTALFHDVTHCSVLWNHLLICSKTSPTASFHDITHASVPWHLQLLRSMTSPTAPFHDSTHYPVPWHLPLLCSMTAPAALFHEISHYSVPWHHPLLCSMTSPTALFHDITHFTVPWHHPLPCSMFYINCCFISWHHPRFYSMTSPRSWHDITLCYTP